MFRPKIVCFDLNKTLIEENTWLNLNLAMGVTQAEDDMLMAWGREGIIDDQTGQTILCEIYKRRGDVSRTNIEKVIGKYTYTEYARESIEYCRQKGYEPVLISGVMDMLVDRVAHELGIMRWRAAAQFVFDDENNLTSIVCAPNDAEHKAEQLASIANELGVDITDCVAVGDGDNDARLFEVTGHGVTFTGSPIADKSWKIIGSLKELQHII